MARQSKMQENLGGIFSDLAKIAMSSTINKKSQELQLETNLIELEMRQLSSDIRDAQEEYKDKQSEFQETTGEVFKLNKDEQIEILKDLGLSDAEIKKLKKEQNRVDKILELKYDVEKPTEKKKPRIRVIQPTY